jgi:ferritin-like metal-binding protein YciE
MVELYSILLFTGVFMKVENIQQLFSQCLSSVLDAELQLVEALPLMEKAASTKSLKEGFKKHLEQTKKHVERLEQVAEHYEVIVEEKTNPVMKALISVGQEKMGMEADGSIIDAALVGAAQAVEHYEMAAYVELISLASMMDENDAIELMQKTLEEEEETSQVLMEVGEEVLPELATETEEE